MNRLILLLAILGGGLAVLLFNHGEGESFGLDNDDFGRLVSLSAIGALLGAGILGSRHRWGETLRQLAIWVVILMALAFGYIYRGDVQSIGQRLTSALVPGRPVVMTSAEGTPEVVLYKRMNGHFETNVSIDNFDIRALVDTGASNVALSFEDAERIGLDPRNLRFTVPVMTANGRAMAAPVMLEQVAIGPIVRRNVRATVAERGRLDQSLLGMSFLSSLSSMQMQTDELRLRD